MNHMGEACGHVRAIRRLAFLWPRSAMIATGPSLVSRAFAPRLTLDDAVRIRLLYATGTPVRQLAAEYRITSASIYEVLRARAHPCVITVQLSDDVYVKLNAAAKAANRTAVNMASVLVARGLEP
jgi:hypothetical protein